MTKSNHCTILSSLYSRVIGFLLLLLLLSVSSCSPAFGYEITSPNLEDKEVVIMSINEWNTLKKEFAQQKLDLMSLEETLNILEKESTVSQQELIKLQNQLLESKKVIIELEKNYSQAKNNLQELKNDLRESRILLTQLKLEVKQLQQENKRLRAQRDTYAYGGAVLLIASVAAFATK